MSSDGGGTLYRVEEVEVITSEETEKHWVKSQTPRRVDRVFVTLQYQGHSDCGAALLYRTPHFARPELWGRKMTNTQVVNATRYYKDSSSRSFSFSCHYSFFNSTRGRKDGFSSPRPGSGGSTQRPSSRIVRDPSPSSSSTPGFTTKEQRRKVQSRYTVRGGTWDKGLFKVVNIYKEGTSPLEPTPNPPSLNPETTILSRTRGVSAPKD